jgi:ElaB/YqjD/DUF883 family membrane-anchored ribosome-binding protein
MSAQTMTTSETHNDAAVPAESPESEDALQRGMRAVKAGTLRAAEELRAAAEQKARDWARVADATAEDLRQRAEQALKQTQVQLKTLHTESESYVREHPLKSVLVALGAGFLVGVLVRR